MRKFLYSVLLSTLFFSSTMNAQNRGYEKSIEVGYAIGVGNYNNDIFNLSMINGYRFNSSIFAGIGVGIGYSNALNAVDISRLGITKEFRTEAIPIPIYANIKANLSKEAKTSPFLSFNIGYTIDVNQYLKDAPGFMLQPNFGVDFQSSDNTSIYGLIGLNLQHYDYAYTRNLGTTTSDWEATIKSEMLKAIDLKIGFRF